MPNKKKLIEHDPVADAEEQKGHNALAKYCGEMRKIPLLTKEQEAEIGGRIIYSKTQELRKKAVDELVRANLRLVMSVANKYRNRGMSVDDLIQEGNIGLMKAAQKFDINKDCRFSTYAVRWIRSSIMKALVNLGHTIRIPMHAEAKVKQLYRVVNFLGQKLEREPTLVEIAAEMEISVEKAETIYRLSDLDCFSLDARVTDYEVSAASRLAMTADENSPDPLVELERKQNAERVQKSLAGTSPRACAIIEKRFGISSRGREEKSLREVSNEMNIHSDKIRQIQARVQKGLKKKLSV
jgi:RNA polymerase primary sigma factor